MREGLTGENVRGGSTGESVRGGSTGESVRGSEGRTTSTLHCYWDKPE